MNTPISTIALLAALALPCGQALRAESAPAPAPAPAAPVFIPLADDPDGDFLSGKDDPEPLVSNLCERFSYRLESPTLTWELNMEQLTQTESTLEQTEQEASLLREAAQGVLDETTQQENIQFTQGPTEEESGWMSLSINPLQILGKVVGGLGAMDALAGGVRLSGGAESHQRKEDKNNFLVLNRLTHEQGKSKTELAERRTRLLRLQRFTKVLRNPRLQLTLHIRNGSDQPLVIGRPEVPVLTGERALGVAVPQDPRDREQIIISPHRSQVILLQVPVADSDFWNALTQGADALRYAPELGAMRAAFVGQLGTDLLAVKRAQDASCLPLRLLLPEGVVMEQALARADGKGAPVTVREAIKQWNVAWRRQHPETKGDLFVVDESGMLVSAAGRTGSLLGALWQVEVDGKPLALGQNLDVPVRQGVRMHWGEAKPTSAEMADLLAKKIESPWLKTGLAAFVQYQDLRAGADPKIVAGKLTAMLGEAGLKTDTQLLTTLGEAHRLAGDLGAAQTAWRKAARQGDAQSILALAGLALDAPGRLTEGLSLMRQAASAGNPEALARLSDLEANRPGADANLAPQLLGQAAEAGHAPALTLLGQRYENGEGLPRDATQAATLYRLAAAQGDVGAMLRLGILYETGQGVPQDSTRAATWYRAAATGEPLQEIAP